jgi:hypothetical protein
MDNVAVIVFSRPVVEQTLSPATGAGYDDRLFQLLRAVRKSIADANGWPPYVVFHDTTLKEMARTKPCSLEEMAGMPGVGKKKRDSYGAEFVNAIREYVNPGGVVRTPEKAVNLEKLVNPEKPVSQEKPVKREPEHPVLFQNFSLNGQSTLSQISEVTRPQNNNVNIARDYDPDIGRENRIKLIEEANQLQKQIGQLNRELENAKKSLGEVLKKISAENNVENGSDKIAKVEGRSE